MQRLAAQKILSNREAKDLRQILQSQSNTIVLCHGVFDLLHPGHIAHFEDAKTHGSVLVVSLTSDAFVNKGPGRPVLSEDLRASMLSALEIVDFVWISRNETAQSAIELIRPDVFVKGPDYSDPSLDPTGNIQREIEAVKKCGGRVAFTTSPTMSSSRLANSLSQAAGSELGKWLPLARRSVSAGGIENWFSDISKLKILVIGEAIVDYYEFVEALGKTSKEPVLAFLRRESEMQLGGSIAVAKHALGLGAQTTLITRIGDDTTGREVKALLEEEGDLQLLLQTMSDEVTIRKTRFIDESTGTKVFETYEMTDEPVSEIVEAEFLTMLDPIVDEFDLILVADYGHGLLTEGVLKRLSQARGILAVNTQSNAGNRGFNSITRYPRVDIASLNGGELQLELRKRHTNARTLLPELGTTLGATWMMVTEGAKGMSIWNENSGVQTMPAFTEFVKDRVGAGDALFAVSSALLAVNAPVEAVGLFGNLAGASMVSGLGNSSSLVSADLIRYARVALK